MLFLNFGEFCFVRHSGSLTRCRDHSLFRMLNGESEEEVSYVCVLCMSRRRRVLSLDSRDLVCVARFVDALVGACLVADLCSSAKLECASAVRRTTTPVV